VSQRDLRWFFAQWVERKGAPNFKLPDVQVMMQGNGNDRKYYIKAHVMQNQPPFQLRLPVQIRMVDGQVSMLELNVRSTDHTFTIPVRGQPVTFHVDPSFEIFRWLNRSHLPPMLNLFVTDQNRTVVLPSHGDPAFYRPYEDLVARIQSQDSSGNPVVVKAENELRMPKDYGLIDQSVMILGSPKLNRLTEWAARGCGNQIHLEDDKVTIAGKVYEGPELAVLISCRHPDYPTRVVTMFYGQTPSTTAKVGRLLFFYGWQSYLIFREGAVVARGDFLPEQSELEIRFHAP
jgi:aminopeptidase N